MEKGRGGGRRSDGELKEGGGMRDVLEVVYSTFIDLRGRRKFLKWAKVEGVITALNKSPVSSRL
jgi:hypothetical protein